MSRLALAGALIATVVAVALGVLLTDPVPPRPHAHESPPARRAVEVLRSWDAERSAAWARGDTAALRDLYVAGSVAGRRDVRSLTAYAARGLVVRGIRMQLLSAQVLADRPRLVRLRVTDRLTGAVVVRGGESSPFPADRATTRTLTLRLVGGRWRMASVEGA